MLWHIPKCFCFFSILSPNLIMPTNIFYLCLKECHLQLFRSHQPFWWGHGEGTVSLLQAEHPYSKHSRICFLHWNTGHFLTSWPEQSITLCSNAYQEKLLSDSQAVTQCTEFRAHTTIFLISTHIFFSDSPPHPTSQGDSGCMAVGCHNTSQKPSCKVQFIDD